MYTCVTYNKKFETTYDNINKIIIISHLLLSEDEEWSFVVAETLYNLLAG